MQTHALPKSYAQGRCPNNTSANGNTTIGTRGTAGNGEAARQRLRRIYKVPVRQPRCHRLLKSLRPVALRPCLSTSMPFSSGGALHCRVRHVNDPIGHMDIPLTNRRYCGKRESRTVQGLWNAVRPGQRVSIGVRGLSTHAITGCPEMIPVKSECSNQATLQHRRSKQIPSIGELQDSELPR